MRLSPRIAGISESATLAITSRAKELKAQGEDMVVFGVGEPDFITPDHIRQAAIDASNDGYTKYATPASGIVELKAAIINKLSSDNGLEYKPSEIIVSCGAKHSLYNVILAACSEGDEVLLPSPYWVSYPEQVRASGADVVVIDPEPDSGFRVTAEQVRAAATERTRALILNSPSNPTGAVYTPEQLEAIAEVCVEKGILVISDEIYESLLYGGAMHKSIASFGPEIKALTVTVNGVSKAYAMTGWRIGYAAGPQEIIGAAGRLQSHSTSGPCSISQKAAVAALTGPFEPVNEMVKEFAARRELICSLLDKIDGMKLARPEGAFYVFPDISAFFGRTVSGRKIESAMDFAMICLEEAKVALVPGEPFGAPNCVRLSYATSREMIEKGVKRIARMLA